jgi:hypothetical protein
MKSHLTSVVLVVIFGFFAGQAFGGAKRFPPKGSKYSITPVNFKANDSLKMGSTAVVDYSFTPGPAPIKGFVRFGAFIFSADKKTMVGHCKINGVSNPQIAFANLADPATLSYKMNITIIKEWSANGGRGPIRPGSYYLYVEPGLYWEYPGKPFFGGPTVQGAWFPVKLVN